LAKSLCILGRQPALGLAELESLYSAEHVRPIVEAALLDIPAEEINFKRLGGTIKTARVLATLPYTDWRSITNYLRDNIPKHLLGLPEGKFTLGLSVYGLSTSPNDINKTGLELKKLIKANGRSVRIVPNKSLELNSAQVLHNKLTHRGAWELLLVRDGNQTILAQTLFVQDIEAYAARDQARPARDARVGMLPPKLAQIIINLATGPITVNGLAQRTGSSKLQGAGEQQSKPYKEYGVRVAEPATQQDAESGSRVSGSAGKQADAASIVVLDPFCGTGVILQEALLMGLEVVGTDIDERMVEYSTKNIEWLRQRYGDLPESKIEAGDATSYSWSTFDYVASEVYLGRALNSLPAEAELKQIVSDANTIIKKFLVNLAPQLNSDNRICLAVPAWRKPNGQIVRLPLLHHLTDMGYNYLDLKHVRREDLIYYRNDQNVARQLIRLVKV